jgi:hypothetical protein
MLISKFNNKHPLVQEPHWEIPIPAGPSSPIPVQNRLPQVSLNLSVQRLAIAKFAAQKNPKETAQNIGNYGLTQSQKFQMAKWIAQWNPTQIIKNIEQFELSPSDRFEVAKIVALRMKPRAMAQAIQKFRLENITHRFEIAKTIAKTCPATILSFIKNFDLSCQALRFEIAKIAAQKDGWETAKHLDQFDLSRYQQTQVMTLAISDDPKALGYADLVFGEQNKDLIGLISMVNYEDDDILKNFGEILSHYLSKQSCDSLIKQVEREEDLDFIGDKISFVAASLYIWKQTLSHEEFAWVDKQKWIEKILPIRGSESLLRLVDSVSNGTQYRHQFENLELKIETKYKWGALLKLPLARLKNAGVDPQPLIDCLNTTCFKQLKDLVKFYSLLKTLELFSRDPELTSDEKTIVLKELTDHPKQLFDSAKDLLMILECRKSAKLKSISKQISLSQIAEKVLLEVLPIPGAIKNLDQRVRTVFGAYRQPNAIRRLTGKLVGHKNALALNDLGIHISSVLKGTYRSLRYSTNDNPHLARIPRETLRKWQINSYFPLSTITQIEDEKYKDLVIVETDDPEDVLLVGSEGETSCTSVDEEFGQNIGLPGYLHHGQTRLIAIKKGKKGPILARAILRLLHDGKNPVLFVENVYSIKSDENFDRAIIAMAKKTAARLECSLTTRKGKINYPKPLHSYGGPAAAEYSDMTEGLNSAGYFKIKNVKFLN